MKLFLRDLNGVDVDVVLHRKEIKDCKDIERLIKTFNFMHKYDIEGYVDIAMYVYNELMFSVNMNYKDFINILQIIGKLNSPITRHWNVALTPGIKRIMFEDTPYSREAILRRSTLLGPPGGPSMDIYKHLILPSSGGSPSSETVNDNVLPMPGSAAVVPPPSQYLPGSVPVSSTSPPSQSKDDIDDTNEKGDNKYKLTLKEDAFFSQEVLGHILREKYNIQFFTSGEYSRVLTESIQDLSEAYFAVDMLIGQKMKALNNIKTNVTIFTFGKLLEGIYQRLASEYNYEEIIYLYKAGMRLGFSEHIEAYDFNTMSYKKNNGYTSKYKYLMELACLFDASEKDMYEIIQSQIINLDTEELKRVDVWDLYIKIALRTNNLNLLNIMFAIYYNDIQNKIVNILNRYPFEIDGVSPETWEHLYTLCQSKGVDFDMDYFTKHLSCNVNSLNLVTYIEDKLEIFVHDPLSDYITKLQNFNYDHNRDIDNLIEIGKYLYTRYGNVKKYKDAAELIDFKYMFMYGAPMIGYPKIVEALSYIYCMKDYQHWINDRVRIFRRFAQYSSDNMHLPYYGPMSEGERMILVLTLNSVLCSTTELLRDVTIAKYPNAISWIIKIPSINIRAIPLEKLLKGGYILTQYHLQDMVDRGIMVTPDVQDVIDKYIQNYDTAPIRRAIQDNDFQTLVSLVSYSGYQFNQEDIDLATQLYEEDKSSIHRKMILEYIKTGKTNV